MKHKFYPRYTDKYGTVWVKIDRYYVWNQRLGYGLWDNGKGFLFN